MNSEHPKVFISYSWEEEAHKEWVKSLADRLLSDGIEATVDQYDLTLGDRLPHFMEQSISNSDYVLIICTPTYKGGVGYEGHIISAELLTQGNERKFIPVIRKGTATNSIPTFLSGKLGIDLSNTIHYENSYKDLLTTLYGVKRKPQIGTRPPYIPKSQVQTLTKYEDEPIHILGIITDEVTVPKMDGSRGCALYKIPFKLSKSPSHLWKEIFVATWNMPPRFTTMHRPGIASVYGNKIILDGTTMEEVRDYHRETLLLCVEEANKKEAQIIREQQLKKAREEQRKKQHYDNVNNIADTIKF